jgi:DNA-binding XRE family transcriptional regulator
MDLGLTQEQVAKIIGVTEATVYNWETYRRSFPAVEHMSKIIEFLEYNPLPEATTPQEQLKRYRLTVGLSQEKMAKQLGVDETTIANWERGNGKPTKTLLEVVNRIADY